MKFLYSLFSKQMNSEKKLCIIYILFFWLCMDILKLLRSDMYGIILHSLHFNIFGYLALAFECGKGNGKHESSQHCPGYALMRPIEITLIMSQ